MCCVHVSGYFHSLLIVLLCASFDKTKPAKMSPPSTRATSWWSKSSASWSKVFDGDTSVTYRSVRVGREGGGGSVIVLWVC